MVSKIIIKVVDKETGRCHYAGPHPSGAVEFLWAYIGCLRLDDKLRLNGIMVEDDLFKKRPKLLLNEKEYDVPFGALGPEELLTHVERCVEIHTSFYGDEWLKPFSSLLLKGDSDPAYAISFKQRWAYALRDSGYLGFMTVLGIAVAVALII